jgi:PIN domain nuclease of toxin-antitoxin system
MKLLLDTHVFLWWLADDPALRPATQEAIGAPDADIYVSAVSVWEVAIKIAVGKLEPTPIPLVDAIVACGFQELPIYARHCALTVDLPRHHGDPFDRLLVAQARSEDLTLVTNDRALRRYEVPIMAA